MCCQPVAKVLGWAIFKWIAVYQLAGQLGQVVALAVCLLKHAGQCGPVLLCRQPGIQLASRGNPPFVGGERGRSRESISNGPNVSDPCLGDFARVTVPPLHRCVQSTTDEAIRESQTCRDALCSLVPL